MPFTLKQITDCFPSVRDWEDSYMADGRQRLLATTGRINIEIILGPELRSITFLLDEVSREVITCVTLLFDSQRKALTFLEEAAIYGRDNPNLPFEETVGEMHLVWKRMEVHGNITQMLTVLLPPDVPPPQRIPETP